MVDLATLADSGRGVGVVGATRGVTAGIGLVWRGLRADGDGLAWLGARPGRVVVLLTGVLGLTTGTLRLTGGNAAFEGGVALRGIAVFTF